MQPDCDQLDHPALLTLDEALARIWFAVEPVSETQRVSLSSEAALGRILAHDLLAPLACPPFDNAAMDGYALRSADTAEQRPSVLEIVGVARAGHPCSGPMERGQCIRIFTGAAMPADADAVVMQEAVKATDTHITVTGPVAAGQWVRAAGRDLAQGHRALPAGKRLSAIDIGLIAALGLPEIIVKRRLRVGILSTGDELTPLGAPLAPGAIYDSNRLAIKSLLHPLALDVTDLGTCRDERDALRRILRDAATWNDVLITIGGASVGDADHVVPALEAIGRVELWKVAVKPGKPFLYGRIDDCHVFGLPGNPASALVTCLQLVRPALLQRMGALAEPPLRVHAISEQALAKRSDRMEFQRGIYRMQPGGVLAVTAVAGQDADRLASFSAANCFIVLPADSRGAAAGEPVIIEPFSSNGYTEKL